MRNQINSKFAQHGAGMYGWMIILAVIGFFALLGMRCIPVYLKHYEVVGILQWATEQKELAKAPPSQIRSRIQRRIDSGYVYHLTSKDVKIKKTKDGRRFLQVTYDLKRPFVYNIELLFHFDTVKYFPHAN